MQSLENKIKQLERKIKCLTCSIVDGGGGSGGAFVIDTTYENALTLIQNNELQTGALYRITGFYKNKTQVNGPNYPVADVLFDDGTNSGTTIILTALDSNTLSAEGWGEFYNPIYGDQTTYENTDGTGLYGIWDGDNPDPLLVPAYVVDQVVFWGGYAWKNLLGNVGNKVSCVELNSDDWEKIPYSNTTYYQKVIDYIEVDFQKDYMIRRRNAENNIDVVFPADTSMWWMGNDDFHAISVMQWGNYSKIDEGLDNGFYGINSIIVNDSYCEIVNNKGNILNLDVLQSSTFYDNYIGFNTYVDEVYLIFYSYIYSNTLDQGSSMYYNTLTGSNINSNTLTGSSMYYNTLTGSNINSNTLTGSSMYYNTLTGSYINSNTLTGSSMYYNTLDQGSSMYYNTLDQGSSMYYNTLDQGSSMYYNTLDQGSSMYYNTLDQSSYIDSNTLTGSGINYNTLDQSSYINSNTLDQGSYIDSNTLTGSSMYYNTLTGSYINSNTLTFSILNFSTSGTLTTKTIQKVNIKNTNFNEDISASTVIFLNTEKTIFIRLDNTKRLSYYDNSDTLTIVNVNA